MENDKIEGLPGSERVLPADAELLGTGDPEERVQVTVQLRARAGAGDPAAAPVPARPLSREEFAERFGADPDDIATLEGFATEHGLQVVGTNAPACAMTLAGPRSAMSAAFAVDLQDVRTPSGTFRARTGPVHVPRVLAGLVDGVFGLDDRPQARPHFVVRSSPAPDEVAGAVESHAGFTARQVADMYGIGRELTGAGQAVALIELGGGYRDVEVGRYFEALGLPRPTVRPVRVDGARNAPTGSPDGPDGEVMLDIEVVGAVAPGATVLVYFAPNTSAGFLDVINAAVHDAQNKPSVISISWGSPEPGWTASAMVAMDRAFANAALMGVTVTVASGDDGSSDRVGDGQPHVDFPASSPHVLGCGGTRVTVGPGGELVSETAWGGPTSTGASGGGYSVVFDRPAWQPAAPTGRGVPDVAGNADPQTGYAVLVDGSWTVVGGTSAVAPLWAGILACANERSGAPAGFVNTRLYERAGSGVVRDITDGTNGAYRAGTGWDAVTGLGSPLGPPVVDLLATPEG